MHAAFRLLATAVIATAACAANAQARVRSVQPVPSPRPSASTLSSFAAPKPAGLTPPLPAGLTDGSGAAVATDPVAAGNTITRPAGTGTPGRPGTAGVFGNAAGTDLASPEAATTVLGAGGATVPGPSQDVNAGAGGYAEADIARSFYFADANHDGELTPAEFNRLTIRPLSFEQMDRNFDGRISRFEYDDATH